MNIECLIGFTVLAVPGLAAIWYGVHRLKTNSNQSAIAPLNDIPDYAYEEQDVYDPGHITAESAGAKTVPNVLNNVGPRQWESPMQRAPNTKNGHSGGSLN